MLVLYGALIDDLIDGTRLSRDSLSRFFFVASLAFVALSTDNITVVIVFF